MGRRPKGDEGSFPKTRARTNCCCGLANGEVADISGKETVKAFRKAGWEQIGQVGSHVVMVKADVRVNLSIPQHKELSVGTLQALIRNVGLTVEEFLSLL
ncbi:type II toxin-antitoxin system HicA family toxin [Nitrospira sp. BLG_2]|uniref:type II toxin-antitoxin system HicA family toxin n=1 Tax=Nitrospira sp. BLG_2 TaxID=3397507 RepID=UPI003B998B2A